MSFSTPVPLDETQRSETQHTMIEPSETSHALSFSHMLYPLDKISILFKYSLADEDWERKACQQFSEVASSFMDYGAPELALTAYVQLGVVDEASGSGSVQFESAFSRFQLQDSLPRHVSATMDAIKRFLVSLSGGSTLQVQYIIRMPSGPSRSPVEESLSETPRLDVGHARTTLAGLQTPVSDSNLAAPTSLAQSPPARASAPAQPQAASRPASIQPLAPTQNRASHPNRRQVVSRPTPAQPQVTSRPASIQPQAPPQNRASHPNQRQVPPPPVSTQPSAPAQRQTLRRPISGGSPHGSANTRIDLAEQKVGQIGKPEANSTRSSSKKVGLEIVLFDMDVPGFREELLPLLSFEDRLSLSQTCVRLNHWVTRNVVVFQSATGSLHHASYKYGLDQTYVRYEKYDPSSRAPVIFRWEGCELDGVDHALENFVAAFKSMLRFANSIRIIEISKVHGLSPEWIWVSRLKDFTKLRRLRVEFSAPWDLALFGVNNEFQQSLLDLAIGHDTHFEIDFYAYDARNSGEWNKAGPCASRSTFERVYPFFRDRHPHLLLQGSLVNQMLTRMIIADPGRRPFSASNLERPSDLERMVSQSIQDSLYETPGASGPTPRDATRFYKSLIRLITPGWQESANYNKTYKCAECEGSFTGYCFPEKQTHGRQRHDPVCGGCIRDEVQRRHSTVLSAALTPLQDRQRKWIHKGLLTWLAFPTLNDRVKFTELAIQAPDVDSYNNRSVRTTYSYAQSPSLRFLVENITGSDPLLDLRSQLRFGTVHMPTDVSKTARISRSPPLTAMHLHRVCVQAPNIIPSTADIVHLGRARIPPRPLRFALPDTAETSSAQQSSTSPTETATHGSPSIIPPDYDGDLLRQICPAHLLGTSCEHKDLLGTDCDRLWVCEYIEGYECQGTTCRYLHGIPRTCHRAVLGYECDACGRAHDYLDARRDNLEDMDDHLVAFKIGA